MSPGIDIGEIIQPCWLPKLAFESPNQQVDTKMLYRAIYSFLDPWVRSFVLREVLASNHDFMNLKSHPQNEKEGLTYHFMHPKLQAAAIQRILSDKSIAA